MKNNLYIVDNSIEKILNKENTLFLTPLEYKQVISKIRKNEYKVYKPYIDSDKVILYVKEIPDVLLYKINTRDKLRHQDILGSIFNLGITNNTFGDIVIKDNNYYLYILPKIERVTLDNLTKIGNSGITLERVNLEELANYEREYETIREIVPSLRLDVIASNIAKTSRNKVLDLFKNKDILLNYEIANKPDYILKSGDVFSIRRIGKYKYIDVIKNTKSNKLLIEYKKYL